MDYVLKTPITVSGNKIDTVTLREPTFDEISEIGLPGDVPKEQKMGVLKKYVEVCSGLPSESVGSLGIRDAMALIRKVSDFFIDTE